MSNYFKELGKIHANEGQEKNEKSSPLTFKLPEVEFEKLEFYCKKMGISKSKFINMLFQQKINFAIAEYLETSQKKFEYLDTCQLTEDQISNLKLAITFYNLESK